MITVAKDGSGDYTSVQEAIDSITSVPETVFIKNGIYKERVEIHKDNITLIGENADGTVITNNYYAFMPMEDGSKRGTFRSYTFFVQANHFNAYNITFENSAGFGKKVGQAIAVYAEGDDLVFKNCHMLGHQDTLFTGPLPMKEKQPGGFVGPTEFAPRIPGRQLYEDCFISGEVDFIFGSAICYFKNCELYALNRNETINSYYTAPSTYDCLLSKMMISGANILILDEPTNHLDMESITALNNGLIKFPGVLLFASHDHQFVQTTANRIMEIMPNGSMIDKITTYDEYLASDEMARKRQVYLMQEEDN